MLANLAFIFVMIISRYCMLFLHPGFQYSEESLSVDNKRERDFRCVSFIESKKSLERYTWSLKRTSHNTNQAEIRLVLSFTP